jgi:hypothetical protein
MHCLRNQLDKDPTAITSTAPSTSSRNLPAGLHSITSTGYHHMDTQGSGETAALAYLKLTRHMNFFSAITAAGDGTVCGVYCRAFCQTMLRRLSGFRIINLATESGGIV